jgi:hypothetical protein
MMLRLVLASLAAILAGSAAHAQVGMRSPRSAITPGGSSAMGISGSACPSGGGTAGTTNGGSNFAVGGSTMFGGQQSAFGMNPSTAYGMPSIAVANNGYGVYNATAGGYDASWGYAPEGFNLGVGMGMMGDMNAYQDLANNRNRITDLSTVAASVPKASTRPKGKSKIYQPKIRSQTAKTS